MTGETKFTGNDFTAKAIPASYVGADQLEGQANTEPSTPVPGRYFAELNLFQPTGSTIIYEVVPTDITLENNELAVSA